ncbi:MAG: Rpn family recombination-promoting nuclease/putative transposase, partial [Methylococcaceae bacterium]
VGVPELLQALINAVRVLEKPVEVLEILNPIINAEELTGKFIILDVLARDVDGQQYNLEMQVRGFPLWGSRSCYYLARLLSQQLESGHEYGLLKPVIGIHLLDFDLFTTEQKQEQAVWRFEMRDAIQPHIRLSADLQLHLIELRKADRLGLIQDDLREWVTFFRHWNEEQTMANLHSEPVKKAYESLKNMSADTETRRLAFVRERALHDEATVRMIERKEGLEEGKVIGLEVGKVIGKEIGRE